MNEKKLQKEKVTAKNTALNLVIILLLATIIVSSVIGLYAWAKYQSAIGGSTEAQVAKWHFELKGDITKNTENTSMALTRTDGYEHVAEGKLAPGTSGKLPITIDTTKTEVDLIYDLVVTITNFPQNMKLKNAEGQEITPLVLGEGTDGKPKVATITLSKYVPWETEDTNRLHDETIKWNWPYETGIGDDIVKNDKIDTQDAGKEITVSISVTGTQVLENTLEGAVATTLINGELSVYNTVQGAVDAADNHNGALVTLLENQTVDGITIANTENFVLDLNGKTLTVTNSVINNGTLKIVDSTSTREHPEGIGKIQAVNNVITNNGDGTLIIDSGTLQTSGMGAGHTYSVIDQNSAGTVTINNGTIIANDVGIAVNSTGKVTINNGRITSNQDDAIHCYSVNNVLEINDGSITGAGCGVCSAGTTDIRGGTIESTNSSMSGSGIFGVSGTLTIGTDDETVNSSLESKLRVVGVNYGVYISSSNLKVNYYYDGVIVGPSGNSIGGMKPVIETPEYYRVKTTDNGDGTETTYLSNI